MTYFLRACVGVAPALLVLVGSLWMSRGSGRPDQPAGVEAASFAHGEIVALPTQADEDRLHRVALKQETVGDLLEGRITFAEALDRFELFSAATPSPKGPGDTPVERASNQILAFARVRAGHEPERYAERLAQIESEAHTLTAASN